MNNKELKAETEVQQSASAEVLMSSQTIAKPIVERRFFFICTVGREFNNSMSFNAFDIKTDDGNYPTYRKCLEVSETKYPNQRAVTLLSISEVPVNDWQHFLSVQ